MRLDSQALANELGKPADLDQVVETFRRWLYLPDERPLLAVLATVAANRLAGDPVWLVLVGPPGSGKSELLQSLTGLDDVHPAATLTEAAFLSGTPQKSKAKDAKGGLLRVIGDHGIIVGKDFTSVLSMHHDARAAVLAAMREIYDGNWTRHVGTDGGRTLHWSGKVGFIAGCTPTIDRHHAVMGSMGERFILLRLPTVDPVTQATRALEHAGKESAMRSELTQAVNGLFTGTLPDPIEATDEERSRLIALSTFVVKARSAVERDGYSRDIELVPDAEAPTRLVVQLDRLRAGLAAIGATQETAWRVLAQVAQDSMPKLRWRVIETLAATDGKLETPEVAKAVDYPSKTTWRTLEDLQAHGVIERTLRTETDSRADSWNLAKWARDLLATCFPEKSYPSGRGDFKSVLDLSDISGKQAERGADS